MKLGPFLLGHPVYTTGMVHIPEVHKQIRPEGRSV